MIENKDWQVLWRTMRKRKNPAERSQRGLLNSTGFFQLEGNETFQVKLVIVGVSHSVYVGMAVLDIEEEIIRNSEK